jgi:lysozyme
MANDLWDGATVPAAATSVVKRVEGFFAHPYDDNGALPGGTWTIGYGTIRDAAGKAVTPVDVRPSPRPRPSSCCCAT